MIEFKKSPERNRLYVGDSEWITDIYNQYFDKKDGFVVEIGVGHVLDWEFMGTPRILNENDKIVRAFSTTYELIEHGWKGIYIDPIKEFLFNEMIPIIKKTLPEERWGDVKLAPFAASNDDGVMQIIYDETLGFNGNEPTPDNQLIPYQYRGRFVQRRKTSDILNELNCPKNIDVMLIDVEGHELNTISGIDFNKHLPKLLFIETNKIPLSEIKKIIPQNYSLIKEDGLNSALIYND